MTNTITITVAMIAAALLTFVAIPLQALAQVCAGGTVGTPTKEPELDVCDIAEPPKISVPEPDLPETTTAEPELPAIPELFDLPKPDLPTTAEPELPDIPEPKLPAIPELSDLPNPEL